MLGIVGIADRTPSPRGSALTPAQGKQNKHSPWTAARNRKKNRVQEEERPLPLYDDNSEEENQPTASGQEDVNMSQIAHGMQRLRVVRRSSVAGDRSGKPVGPRGGHAAATAGSGAAATRASCPDGNMWSSSFSHISHQTAVAHSFAHGSAPSDASLMLHRSASATSATWGVHAQPLHMSHPTRAAVPVGAFDAEPQAAPSTSPPHATSKPASSKVGRPPLQPVGHASAEAATLRNVLRPLPVNSLSAEGLQFSSQSHEKADAKPPTGPTGGKRRSSEPSAPSPVAQPPSFSGPAPSGLHPAHSLPTCFTQLPCGSLAGSLGAWGQAAVDDHSAAHAQEHEGHAYGDDGEAEEGEEEVEGVSDWDGIEEELLCDEEGEVGEGEEEEEEEGALRTEDSVGGFRIMTSIRPAPRSPHAIESCLHRTSSGGGGGWLMQGGAAAMMTPRREQQQMGAGASTPLNLSAVPCYTNAMYPHHEPEGTPGMPESRGGMRCEGYAGGRGGHYSAGGRSACTMTPGSMLRPAQRPRRRAPTPAGPLLGMIFVGDDDDEEEEEDEDGLSCQEGLTPAPSSVAHGSLVSGDAGAPTPAVQLDSANPNRGRFASGAAVLAAAAAALGRRGLRGHVHSPAISHEAELYTPGPYRSAQPPYPQHPVAPQQHELPEEADLTNLMCDECDFCTPPHSPAGTSLAMNAAVNVAAAFPGWVRGIGAGQPDDDGLGGSLGMGGGPSHMMGLHMGCEEADDLEIPPESLSTLQEFNAQLSKAVDRGDRGRAERLWMELRMRAIQPDMCTLNMLMRCLSKSVTHPDEAEELMAEVCALGGLMPNHTTTTLLGEMRIRFEQLMGV